MFTTKNSEIDYESINLNIFFSLAIIDYLQYHLWQAQTLTCRKHWGVAYKRLVALLYCRVRYIIAVAAFNLQQSCPTEHLYKEIKSTPDNFLTLIYRWSFRCFGSEAEPKAGKDVLTHEVNKNRGAIFECLLLRIVHSWREHRHTHTNQP